MDDFPKLSPYDLEHLDMIEELYFFRGWPVKKIQKGEDFRREQAKKKEIKTDFDYFSELPNGKGRITQHQRGLIELLLVRAGFKDCFASFNYAKKSDVIKIYLVNPCPLHKRAHKSNRCALFIFKNGAPFFHTLFCNSLPRLKKSF